MESLIESAARKFGVPPEVLDLIGRDFITEVIDEFPSLHASPDHENLEAGISEEWT